MATTLPTCKYRPSAYLLFNNDLTRDAAAKQKTIRFRVFRNISDGFISKPEVREFIFSRDNGKCVHCSTSEDLTIDHIISVWDFAHNNAISMDKLNSAENLQTLCRLCNSKKPLL